MELKQIKVKVTKMTLDSAKRIESILNKEYEDGCWEMKQIVTNLTTDEYMIIFERSGI